jgi:transposase
MSRYSIEFKEAVIQKMMPPNAMPVSALSKETGVSDVTLYKWRKAYRDKEIAVPGNNSRPDSWSAQDKLAAVIQTAGSNELALSKYCREKGLYPEQVTNWRETALLGYQRDEQLQQKQASGRKEDRRKIKQLESEVRRKDRALAETAALLVLSKESQAIWGDPGRCQPHMDS